MSIREMAYNVIDSMTEEQLNAFLMLFGRYKEPNEETLKALAEVEDMKKNPDNYKSTIMPMIWWGTYWNEIYHKTNFSD